MQPGRSRPSLASEIYPNRRFPKLRFAVSPWVPLGFLSQSTGRWVASVRCLNGNPHPTSNVSPRIAGAISYTNPQIPSNGLLDSPTRKPLKSPKRKPLKYAETQPLSSVYRCTSTALKPSMARHAAPGRAPPTRRSFFRQSPALPGLELGPFRSQAVVFHGIQLAHRPIHRI